MDYVVKTEVFEGPFDLLLHLIARQRVDLWQVSLSRITEDYLAEIRRMRELNLEVATEFLVVAATLLELKAARLLPAPDADPDEVEAVLEERDLLFARVLQYRAYKQVGGPAGGRPVGAPPGGGAGLHPPPGRRRGPPAPHRPRPAGRGRPRGAGPAGRRGPPPGPPPRGPPPPLRPAPAFGRRGRRRPRPAPPRPGLQHLRGPGRPP